MDLILFEENLLRKTFTKKNKDSILKSQSSQE